MKGYVSIVASLFFTAGMLLNQASADLVDFLYNDNYHDNNASVETPRQPERQRNLASLHSASRSNTLRGVKIGSHILRNQLLEAGCVQGGQVYFLKCREDVLKRELEKFSPPR